jgi:hypothetical protein
MALLDVALPYRVFILHPGGDYYSETNPCFDSMGWDSVEWDNVGWDSDILERDSMGW